MPINKLPISVNICTYNEERDIGDCLEKVIRNNPEEIIVIDGGSDDGTVSIAQEKGAIVINASKKGLSSQRQEGIDTSTQPYIAIVDADDHLEDDFLLRLFSELNEYKYDALLGRNLAYMPSTYWEKAMGSASASITYTEKPIDSNMVGRPALYRAEAIKDCGFDSFFDGVGCEDTDLSIRMEKSGYRQGIGTGITRRKHSESFGEIFKKIMKYGKGDAHISYKYRDKFSAILFHQLIRYPIMRSYQAIKRGDIRYAPFFILFGLGRFFSMVVTFINLIAKRPPYKAY